MKSHCSATNPERQALIGGFLQAAQTWTDPVSCVTDMNGRGGSAETSVRYDGSTGLHSSSELKSATTHFLPNDPHLINEIMNTDPKFVSVLIFLVCQTESWVQTSKQLTSTHVVTYYAQNYFSYFNVCQPQDVAAPVSVSRWKDQWWL